jgi:Cu-processing system permease protein
VTAISTTHLSLSDTKTIAAITFLSLRRQRITPFMLTLGLIFIALGLLMSSVDIGVRYRLFENILTSAQAFLLQMIAWLYTFEMIRKEQSLSLFVLPLSTSVSRYSYYSGRFIGVALMLAVFSLFFFIIDIFLLRWIEQQWVFQPLIQLCLFFFSALLSMAILYFFSSFVSAINAVIYSIMFWFIGHGLDELLIFAQTKLAPSVASTVQGLYYILPNFSFFDISSMAINRLPISTESWLFPILYSLGYSFILLALCNLIYQKKPLYPASS